MITQKFRRITPMSIRHFERFDRCGIAADAAIAIF